MTPSFSKLFLFAAALFILTAFDAPKGWIKAGSMPAKYETGTMKMTGRNEPVAYLKSVDEGITGFGTLMQQFSAAAYKANVYNSMPGCGRNR